MSPTFLRISEDRWLNADQIVLVIYQPHNLRRIVHVAGLSEPLHLSEKEIQIVLDWLAETAVPN